MGDARHKNSPIEAHEEEVTPAFRAEARAILRANKISNRSLKRHPGDPGYLICSDEELAAAIGTDKTNIPKILGPPKPSKAKKPKAPTEWSRFVAPIREVLKMKPVVEFSIMIHAERVPGVKAFAMLDDDTFRAWTLELLKES